MGAPLTPNLADAVKNWRYTGTNGEGKRVTTGS
jgi:hypothetical protein